MKVILTGVTGFIGQETLLQCLSNPTITSIVVLSRRALPASTSNSPKLKVRILEDFNTYSPSIINDLAGAEACIWNLGVKNADIATCRKVSVDYTRAAISTFSQLGAENGKPFRIVFMSGFLAVRDQEKSLLFLQEGRRLKGQAESMLLVANEEMKGVLDAFVLRPASVLPKERSLRSVIQGLALSVGVQELSATATDLAINGGGVKVLENAELVKRGKLLLVEKK